MQCKIAEALLQSKYNFLEVIGFHFSVNTYPEIWMPLFTRNVFLSRKAPPGENNAFFSGNMYCLTSFAVQWLKSKLNGSFHIKIRPLKRDKHPARSTCASGARTWICAHSSDKTHPNQLLSSECGILYLDLNNRAVTLEITLKNFLHWFECTKLRITCRFFSTLWTVSWKSWLWSRLCQLYWTQASFTWTIFWGTSRDTWCWVKSSACITVGSSLTGNWPGEAMEEFAGGTSEEIK